MTSSYKAKIYYPLMKRSIGDEETGELRRRFLAQASGDVLEIGFGSGLNLPYYPDSIDAITAIDPNEVPIESTGRPAVHFERMSAGALRFEANRFDCVVSAFTLCSVAELRLVLNEIKRVLKPGGRFLFLEHGKSWFPAAVALQTLANPFYRVLACGCRVNRDILSAITGSGLQISTVDLIHIPHLPISGYYYLGSAVKTGMPDPLPPIQTPTTPEGNQP
jgi:ubiquinone/menaquinone biosynthesis C-methylase UbiE